MTDKKESGPGLFGRLAGGLAGLVVSEESTESAEPAPAPVQSTPAIPFVPAATHGQADPQIRKVLERDVGEAAKPAYSQFLVLQEGMTAVLPNEQLRFQAVLAALGSQGHSIKQVLVDIDECFQALDRKEAEAHKAAADARASRVGTKQEQIVSQTKEIEGLKAKIAEIEVARARLQGEVEAEVRDIESAESRFMATSLSYRQELTDKKAKITALNNGAS